jgi:hypothetical protein
VYEKQLADIEQRWSRRRRRMIDRRTRPHKIWAERRARLVEELGHEPSYAEGQLLDTLCDRLQAQDIIRAERAKGIEPHGYHAHSIASEIRRLMRDLGLVGRKGGTADEGLATVLNGHSR